jgi:hypothetical protein
MAGSKLNKTGAQLGKQVEVESREANLAKLKQAEEEFRKDQVLKCNEEVIAVLSKYSCTLFGIPELGQDGRIVAKVGMKYVEKQ